MSLEAPMSWGCNYLQQNAPKAVCVGSSSQLCGNGSPVDSVESVAAPSRMVVRVTESKSAVTP
jgi:hypothetical protein